MASFSQDRDNVKCSENITIFQLKEGLFNIKLPFMMDSQFESVDKLLRMKEKRNVSTDDVYDYLSKKVHL